MARSTVVLDGGGATLKAAVVAAAPKGKKHAAATASSTVHVLPNQVATSGSASAVLMGDELLEKEQHRAARMRYMRPVERGYCVNWNIESDLWAHLFGKKMMQIDPHDHELVATSPLFAPTVVEETMDQVVFEEFGFQSFARVPAPEMCVVAYAGDIANGAGNDRARRKAFASSSCHLVVDSGFSFTHVVPVIQGRVHLPAVKRINVGGKLLTNYLKEVVSYRQYNLMDETALMNELKEALCYCSLDFPKEMQRLHTDRSIRKHWALPDFVNSFKGRLLTRDDPAPTDNDQVLDLGLEMITVPEVLFHPSDIGIDQAGLAETIMQAVSECPKALHGALFDNILLVGGNTKIPNFHTRLLQDLRPLVSTDYSIEIHEAADPVMCALDGVSKFARTQECQELMVTKQDFNEHGSNVCRKRFRRSILL